MTSCLNGGGFLISFICTGFRRAGSMKQESRLGGCFDFMIESFLMDRIFVAFVEIKHGVIQNREHHYIHFGISPVAAIFRIQISQLSCPSLIIPCTLFVNWFGLLLGAAKHTRYLHCAPPTLTCRTLEIQSTYGVQIIRFKIPCAHQADLLSTCLATYVARIKEDGTITSPQTHHYTLVISGSFVRSTLRKTMETYRIVLRKWVPRKAILPEAITRKHGVCRIHDRVSNTAVIENMQ